MRRIKLVLAAAAAMATLLVVTAAPAMAQPVGCFFDNNGNLVCPTNGFFPNNQFVSPFNTSGVAPAEQGFSIRRVTSGPANPVTNVSNTGNNVNLCTPVQQVANTGNVANEQGVVQDNANNNGFTPVNNGFFPVNNGFFPNDNFGSGFGGELDLEGSSIDVTPSVSSSCDQTINQSAAA